MTEDPDSDGAVPVTVLGAGEIGLGMAAVLADAGHRVTLVEPDTVRLEWLAERLEACHADMALAGLGRTAEADALAGRVTGVASLADVPDTPGLVVEAGPEAADAKRQMFRAVFGRFAGTVPVITTSSALTISHILPDPSDRARCLCAHPINPPTVLRVIECVPAPETLPETTARVVRILEGAGFVPVTLGREIPGFVFNRLQSAVLREAYRLVEDGVIDVAGLDRLVSGAMGPRWALSGPFETVDLNTAGGIRAHAARMGPAYAEIGRRVGERRASWSPALVEEVHRQRRAIVPEDRLVARVAWRRRALAMLIAARRRILDTGGDDG